MPSIQVRVLLDHIEDATAIETEYDVGQRLLSTPSSEQHSIGEVVQVVPELNKAYMSRLKETKIQRLKTHAWNRAKNINRLMTSSREGRDSVEELRMNPRSHIRRNGSNVERPFDEQREPPMEQELPNTLFSPSTMSDSERLLEEEKQIGTERYQRIINDPHAFSKYTDEDIIPEVVVVGGSKKSSQSKDHVKMNDSENTEENESTVMENSSSDDSWDALNKYDETAVNGNNDTTSITSMGRTNSPATDEPMPEEEATAESKDEGDFSEGGDELKGISFIHDEEMDPQPSTEHTQCPTKIQSADKNNAVLNLEGSTADKCDFGDEPQPSFGNVWKSPCDDLQEQKTYEVKDTEENMEDKVSKTHAKHEDPVEESVSPAQDKDEDLAEKLVSETQVDLEDAVEDLKETKDSNSSKGSIGSLSNNNFPEESVLQLLMKRAERSKKAKKKQVESIAKVEGESLAKSSNDIAATSNEGSSKEESKLSSEPTVITESSVKIKTTIPPRKDMALSSDVLPPQDEKQTEIPKQAISGIPPEAAIPEKSFESPQANADSSKALLDSAFQMIARLQKENTEKDDRLRSSDLYVQSLEKKLFEEKAAMEEERKRRATMDSEQVSVLKDKVSDTLNKLSCEERKSNALQQLISELKEELKEEKSNLGKNQEENITTKALFEREQSQVKQLQNDLAARDQALEDARNRVQQLKEQLAVANKCVSQEEYKVKELQANLLEKESRLENTELKLGQTNMQLKEFLDSLNAREEIERNEEIMAKLKQSIESRQQLIDEEEEKKKEILSKQLENISLAEDHQASAKKVEKSLEKYYQLIQKEKEEVQRLKLLGKEKQEKIEEEQSLIKEIEATIVRKNAIIDLEKVKQRTLESSIAQKSRLLEIETSKMREHKALCTKRMCQIEKEKEAIRIAIQEKEEMLCSEKAAIEYLQKLINTKKTLREEKRVLEKEIPSVSGAEPKRRSNIWTNDMEVEEQKMILQELGKLRSNCGNK